MKAHKRKHRASILDIYRYNVLLSVVLGIVVILVCLCISAVVVSHVDTSLNAIRLLNFLNLGVGSYISGYVCAIKRQHRGMFSGVLCGTLIFMVLCFFSSVFNINGSTLYKVLKAIVCILCGGMGGVKSANVHKI
jgi:putative membrane protein (TIGR04086 family)